MQTDPYRVFWVPGCSACVKTKEFLASLSVPFESVNLLNNPQGAADLAKLGAKSLPIVSRGDQFVFAQSLDQVAEFVGKKRGESTRLAPAELVARWKEILAVARSLITDLPPEKLDYLPIPDRNRTMTELSYHIFQIPDVFVRNVSGEFEDWAHFVNLPVPPEIVTNEDLLEFADYATAEMSSWWDELDEKDCLWSVKTYYGERLCWELLERQTWHSAQHMRQLQSVLEGFGLPLARKARPELYKGLPMPEALWQ